MGSGLPRYECLALADALKWLDACPHAVGSEPVPLEQAFGRVLHAPLAFAADRPDRDLALADGYLVRAEDTLGASSYNPLRLALVPEGTVLRAGCACACHAGQTVPPGANAVLPPEAGEVAGGALDVCDVVARGAGIGRKGQGARCGDMAVPAGRRLGGPQIALAASMGLTDLSVWRRPAVAVVLAGAKPPATEALGAALAGLIARDGGKARQGAATVGALAAAAPADLVLLVGRSGRGGDDDAGDAVAAAGGRLDHHGVALAPGGSVGLGWLGSAPLLLLPGDPISALVSYEVLAGRLLRRLAGRAADWPYPVRRRALSRKIVSPVGLSEWVPVTCDGTEAAPLALAPADGVIGYARADGYLIVPAGLEGHSAEEIVDVVMLGEASSQERE
jgi:molybdopterin molybdotransferase